MPGDPTATTPPPSHRYVGRLGRAYQLEGGIHLRLEDAGRAATVKAALETTLQSGGELFVVGYGAATLREVRFQGSVPVLYLRGVRDRDAARALTGSELYLTEGCLAKEYLAGASDDRGAGASAAPTAGAEAPALEDLPGAEVRLQGRALGRVREVRASGPNPLLVVDAGAGELLLPLNAPYVRPGYLRTEPGTLTPVVTLEDPPAGLLEPR